MNGSGTLAWARRAGRHDVDGRPVGGSWAFETIPGVSGTGLEVLAAGDATHAGVAYGVDKGAGGTDVSFIEKSGSSWATAEFVVNLPFTGATPSWIAALSADGLRAHVLTYVESNYVSNLFLVARTPSGWQQLMLGPGPAGRNWTGYGADGKLWALVTFDAGTGYGIVDDAAYLEP